MTAIPKMLGKKIVYSHVTKHAQIPSIKKALDLLCLARLCTKVKATGANGIPLGTEIDESYFKVIFLDIGLCATALDIGLDKIIKVDEINLINSGGIAEQMAGQLLRTIAPFYINPTLFYWLREKPAAAEIDYVIQHKGQVIPVEVKAGKAGTLKSLHYFMGLKEYTKAIRINSDLPGRTRIPIKNIEGRPFEYELLSLPFYLMSELHRLLDEN